jgi:hypothetical protein
MIEGCRRDGRACELGGELVGARDSVGLDSCVSIGCRGRTGGTSLASGHFLEKNKIKYLGVCGE